MPFPFTAKWERSTPDLLQWFKDRDYDVVDINDVDGVRIVAIDTRRRTFPLAEVPIHAYVWADVHTPGMICILYDLLQGRPSAIGGEA